MLVLATVLVGGAGAATAADEAARARAQLEEIQRRIATVELRLGSARAQRDAVSRTLEATERDLARVAAELRDATEKADRQTAALAALERDRVEAERAVADGRERLALHLRAAYAMGREDRLKLLLNQRDPGLVGRALAYGEHFQRARARELAALRARLVDLDRIEAETREAATALEALREVREAGARALEARREEHALAVTRIDREIADDDARRARLAGQAEELRALLASIEAELESLPLPDDDRPGFATQRGKLRWPVKGRIRNQFGTPRDGDQIAWEGILIDASAGDPVRAISHGRVAYASWLPGLGMLVILDHGAGFMSLYGHNELITKEVGEWVEAGEPIATVGRSGGRSRSALYFEIRQKGEPVDPRAWCRA
ncbi:MAG: peptidoglycan DD-metalloendopeptidase family protein [Ectothiorhodospiraceae bacterium]|nr:peptidoglycan DD-metalloendopeptidase family protein [Chromatiales bacterium]MCP5155023.1 peptidoglycan DD-metalloendopeptidase family protein [Ectothiorhodospiraceae bacterium]